MSLCPCCKTPLEAGKVLYAVDALGHKIKSNLYTAHVYLCPRESWVDLPGNLPLTRAQTWHTQIHQLFWILFLSCDFLSAHLTRTEKVKTSMLRSNSRKWKVSLPCRRTIMFKKRAKWITVFHDLTTYNEKIPWVVLIWPGPFLSLYTGCL